MIRFYIPSFISSDFSNGDSRNGDCTIIDDGKNYEVIDGCCGTPTKRIIARLKALGVKSPYLHLTHFHYDHYNGIEKIIDDPYFTPKALHCQNPASINKNFSKECASNVAAGERIIKKAKAKGIPVIYLNNGDKVIHGDIKFTVYRNQPVTASNTDVYLNDGSLCYWFPEIRYLTTGDAGFDCANEHNLWPIFVKIGHHGNDGSGKNLKPSQMAPLLYKNGCLYCWDNDYSTNNTSFLSTGRQRCIEAGMKFFGVHGDINFVAYGKKVVIYKNGKNYQYPCDYKGKSTLKMADLDIVERTLSGEFGNDDTRVTNLLDIGYYPSNVQNRINRLVKLIKG